MVEGIYFVKTSLEVSLSVHSHSIWQQFIGSCRSTFSSDFFHKVAETFATRILLIGIGLVTSVIVARCLGPEGRGLYAVAATIGAIGVQFGNVGLHASNTYYAARDRKLLPALVGNTIVVSFGFGSLGIALTWIIFFFWPNLAPVHGLLLILSLIWVPFGLAYLLLQNLLLGIQKVRSYNKIELATKILGLGLLGLVIFIRNVTAEMVFLAGLVALVISFIWALGRLLTLINNHPFPSFLLFKENIRYGLKAYLAAFFAFLVLRSDLLIVKYFLGPEQAGYYSVAVSMAEMIYMLPVVVGTILFPKLSVLTDIREKWFLARKISFNTGIGMVLVLAIAGFLAEPIVLVLYGKTFLPSLSAFLWLLPGMLFLGVETVAVQYLNSMGFPITVVIMWILTSVLNVGLNIWAIPVYGIVGASMVSSLSYFVAFALVIWISWKMKVEHD
jgi:O-antigen/teichoic acid export membrane protein